MQASRGLLTSFLVLCLAIPILGQLGVVTGVHINIISLETGALVHEIRDDAIYAGGVQITPDNRLAILTNTFTRGDLVFLNMTAQPPQILDRLDLAPYGSMGATNMAITPDSRFILTKGGFFLSVDIATREVIDGRPYHAIDLAITPDGRFAITWGFGADMRYGFIIFYIAEDGTLWDTGQRPTIPGPGSNGISNLALTPDGRFLVAVGTLQEIGPYVHVFDVSDGMVAYRNSIGIVGQSSALGITVTPDGRKIYLTDSINATVRVLTIDENGNVQDTRTRILVPNGTPLRTSGGITMVASKDYGTFAFLCSANSAVVSIIHVDTDTVLPEGIRLTLRTPIGIAIQR